MIENAIGRSEVQLERLSQLSLKYDDKNQNWKDKNEKKNKIKTDELHVVMSENGREIREISLKFCTVLSFLIDFCSAALPYVAANVLKGVGRKILKTFSLTSTLTLTLNWYLLVC